MPNYSYICEQCENIQDEIHPMSGPKEKIKCNKCGSKKMSRTYLNATPPSVIFKGEGWQTNDGRK